MYAEDILSLVFALSLLLAFLITRYLKHRERLAILEKGIVFPDAPKGGKSYVWARLGFVAFGLFLGIFIEEHFMSAFTLWLGGSLAGLGLLVSYLVFPIESASDPITIAGKEKDQPQISPSATVPPQKEATASADSPERAGLAQATQAEAKPEPKSEPQSSGSPSAGPEKPREASDAVFPAEPTTQHPDRPEIPTENPPKP